MMFDTLPRDVASSIFKHLKTKLGDKCPLFIEDTSEKARPESYIEIRLDGPDIDEISHEEYYLDVDVDLLVVCKKGGNIFFIRNLMGICAEALREDIPLSDAEGKSYGCMSTSGMYGKTEKINLNLYGEASNNKDILQATVSTRFHSFLT